MKLTLRLLFICSAGCSASYGAFSYGAQLNYLGVAATSTRTFLGTSVTEKGDAGGFLALAHFHYSLNLNQAFKIGFGPVVGFGKLTPNAAATYVTASEAEIFRAGAEIMVTYGSFSAFKPFFRGGVGKDFLTDTTSYLVGTSYLSATSQAGGMQWSANLGIKYPFNDVFSAYLQGGLCGGLKSNVTLKNSTGDFAAAGLSFATDEQFSYSCYNLGGGISFDL